MSERFELPTAGEILTEEFLEPLNITPYRLSKDLGVQSSTVLDLVHGKRKITVEMSLRLAKYFGTTSKFWLNLQNELDLREAEIRLEKDLKKNPSLQADRIAFYTFISILAPNGRNASFTSLKH